MHYTPENLPNEYREFFLQTLYNDPLYRKLEAKAHQDIQRAIGKLHSVIGLRLKQNEYLRNALKNYGSDEAVDKVYADNHATLAEIFRKLPEDKKERFDNVVHASVFAIDILDSYVNTLNELIHIVYPTHDFTAFSKLLALSTETQAHLKELHSEQREGYEQIFADEADKIQEYIEKQRMPVFLRRLARHDAKK